MKPFSKSIEASSSEGFETAMLSLVKDFSIEEIIETGTHKGAGSTQIFAKTGLPVLTIECNPEYVAIAKENLKSFPNVTINHAYSLPLATMKSFINNDTFYDNKELDIEIDGDNDPKGLYTKELGEHNIPENLLTNLINGDRSQLIFLDSAGVLAFLNTKV